MLRSPAVTSFAVAGVFGILSTLAFAHHAATNQPALISGSALPRATASATAAAALASSARSVFAAAAPEIKRPSASFTDTELPPLRFTNENSQQSAQIELYDALGHVNEAAAARLDALLCDTRDPKSWATLTLDRRTLQLAVRAALHLRR